MPQSIVIAFGLFLWSTFAFAQTDKLSPEKRTQLEAATARFMAKNNLPGISIDAGTGALQFIAETNTGTLPVALAINRDGKYLYVLDQSSKNIAGFLIDAVTGQLEPVPHCPFGVTETLYSVATDPAGNHLYGGDSSTIIGYRIFDPMGNLHRLSGSPFSGVLGAYGLSLDLSSSFLYGANNSGNTVSAFQVDADGNLRILNDSPYSAGTNAASVTVVSSFQ